MCYYTNKPNNDIGIADYFSQIKFPSSNFTDKIEKKWDGTGIDFDSQIMYGYAVWEAVWL